MLKTEDFDASADASQLRVTTLDDEVSANMWSIQQWILIEIPELTGCREILGWPAGISRLILRPPALTRRVRRMG